MDFINMRSLWTMIRRKLLVFRLWHVVKVITAVAFTGFILVQVKLLLKDKTGTSHWNYVQNFLDDVIGNFINPRGKVNVEIWYGLCLLNFNALRQYPLFPWEPNERSYLKVGDTLTLNKDGNAFAIRTMGYLHPPLTGYYSFHLRSHTMAQLWLSTSGPSNATKIAYITHNVVDKRSLDIGNSKPVSVSTYLRTGRKYYFEIWQAVNVPLDKELEKTNVQWMLPGTIDFVHINGKHVSIYFALHLHNHKTHRPSNDTVVESSSLEFCDDEDEFTGPLFPLNKTMTTDRRTKLNVTKTNVLLNIPANSLSYMEINAMPYLERSKLDVAFSKCLYGPSYTKKTTYKRYDGVWNTRYPLLYPYDNSWNIHWGSPYTKSFHNDDRFEGALFLKDDEAVSIVRTFMKTLTKKYPGKFDLSSIVNIEKVHDKEKGDRLFLELVLRRHHDNKLYRVSEFFYRAINSPANLCLLENLRWNPNVWVNVILNVKNQAGWVLYFVKEMARILKESSEDHVNFIIVDYGNDGIDIGQEMARQGLKNYNIIKKSGVFHKTSTINMAASNVRDPNSIVLLMDLHLRYPSNLFDKIRKHTIQGKLAFSPILLRLMHCGRPETKHLHSSGFWESLGFGIFSIYKSDWDTFGGMNEKDFKNKWGGEDWEMVDRVLAKGIEIEKLRLPGFYHFYHDKKGMWNV